MFKKSPIQNALHGLGDPLDARQHGVLHRLVVGNGGVLGGDAEDRGVEFVERGSVIRSEMPAPRPQYGQSSSTITARWVLLDRLEQRVEVERPDGTQVDHLGVDPSFVGQLLGGGQGGRRPNASR